MESSIIWAIFFSGVIYFYRNEFRNILKSIANIGNKAKFQWGPTGMSLDLSDKSEFSHSVSQQGVENSEYVYLLKASQSMVLTAEEKLIRTRIKELN